MNIGIIASAGHRRRRIQIQEPSDKKESPLLAFAHIDGKLQIINVSLDQAFAAAALNDKIFHLLNLKAAVNAELYKAQIEELEDLINSLHVKEQDLQNFFEKNPALIMDDAYKQVFPHVALERENDGKLIPDFILEPHGEKLCDILDLKLPSEKIFIEKKDRARFSANVIEAAAQLREYSAYFDEEVHRKKIEQSYGLKVYKPKMIVVIGRTPKIDPIIAKRAQADVPDLSLLTYDDILEKVKRQGK